MMPASGSVSSGNVTRARPGGRFLLRTLPPRARVRAAAADGVVLGVAGLISYWLTTRVLSLVYPVSADDDARGGMWAVIATVFVVRDSYAKSLAAALSRMAATLVGFALRLAYLAYLSLYLWGLAILAILAILVGLSVLVTALIGRPDDAITAAIPTTVLLVVAELSPHGAWQQPIPRQAGWLFLRVIGPRIRLSESP